MELPGIQLVNANEMVLRDLGSRFARGQKLTLAEQNMAAIATGSVDSNVFGPSPAEMKLPDYSMPEMVKGRLISYVA